MQLPTVAVTTVIEDKEAFCKAHADDPILKKVLEELERGVRPKFQEYWVWGWLSAFRRI